MNDQFPSVVLDGAEQILVPEAMVLIAPLGTFLMFARLPKPLPREARVVVASRQTGWSAFSWRHGGSWYGIARIIGTIPTLGFTLAQDGNGLTEVAIARQLTGALGDLAAFLCDSLAPVREVLTFLTGPASQSDEAYRMILGVLSLIAKPSGFIELAARPETGGMFLQGWMQSPIRGKCQIFTPAGLLAAEAAQFLREDILAPAGGLCLFAKDWQAVDPLDSAVFLDTGASVLRLDPVAAIAAPCKAEVATEHVRAMLPRIGADDHGHAAFRRICRPRFVGQDTLSGHTGPVAAAFDCVLRGAESGLFVSGWLLDPLHQVDRVLMKSSGNLYKILDDHWHRLARPDLNDGYACDPRFANLLDPRETRHGFLCHIPAESAMLDGADVYLELVLADGGCLFYPLAPVLCRDARAGHAVIACVPRHDPALDDVLRVHIAPFLRRLPPPRRRGNGEKLYLLGGGSLGKPVAALVPLADPRQLDLILAALCDTTDADDLDLIIAADDTAAPGFVAMLESRFRFYGLTGGVMLLRPHLTRAERMDALCQVVTAAQVLIWHPEALPKAPGWLGQLREEFHRLGARGLISPLLSYEDGSVYFDGASLEATADVAVSTVAGLDTGCLTIAQPVPVTAGAAELALVDRGLLEAAGGMAGGLFGDTLAHQDLAARLRAAGGGVWFTPGTAFWMLGGPTPTTDDNERFIAKIDAAQIALSSSQPLAALSKVQA